MIGLLATSDHLLPFMLPRPPNPDHVNSAKQGARGLGLGLGLVGLLGCWVVGLLTLIDGELRRCYCRCQCGDFEFRSAGAARC
jgi:hypothetical protein